MCVSFRFSKINIFPDWSGTTHVPVETDIFWNREKNNPIKCGHSKCYIAKQYFNKIKLK